ncbi:MAG: hypothetical protein IT383_03665 [Deltaproteobacteria bacterium]|nr:hypothetical protein [Deltaproteobacteria bacterium]
MSESAALEVSIEGHRSHELVRDEDLLSLDLQRELESVGSALGAISVIALLAAALPRARRLLDLTPFGRR